MYQVLYELTESMVPIFNTLLGTASGVYLALWLWDRRQQRQEKE